METYGVSEAKLERRINTEQLHMEAIQEALDKVINDLAESKDWEEISLNQLEAEGLIKSGVDREMLLYSLKEDPHIIVKPAVTVDNKPSLTKPFLFKWVTDETKEELNFDGLTYKMVNDGTLERIKMLFGDKPQNTPNSILCLCDYLIREGALSSWILLEPLKISLKTSMPIEVAIKVIDEFIEKGLIVTTEYNTGKKTKTAVRLTFDDESRDVALKEIQNNNVSIDTGSRREKRKNSEKVLLAQVEKYDDKAQSFLKNTKDISKEESVVGTAVSTGLFEIQGEKSKRPIDKIDEFVKILVCNVQEFKDKAHEVLDEQIKVEDDYFKTVNNLIKENSEFKDKIEELKKSLNRQKLLDSKRKEREAIFNGKLNQSFNVLTVKLSVLFEEYSKQEMYKKRDNSVLDDFRSQIIEIITATRESLINITEN